MDIEAIVKKYAESVEAYPEIGLRAALTELAAEYEQKQALLLEAHCERVSSLQERIRQLEAEQVPEGVPSDVITAVGLHSYGLRGKSHAERLSIVAAAPQPKEEN